MKRFPGLVIFLALPLAFSAHAQQPRSAKKHFKRSITLDPHNPLVFAERAVADRMKGRYDEAQRDFEHCLKLNHELRLVIELHLTDLELQIREAQQRQAAIQKRVT